MDSLYDTLKNALQQAADCRKLFEDSKEENQRLAAKYQDILAERQTLREANRALNSTIHQLRARVEDLETKIELQLVKTSQSCVFKTQDSSIAAHKPDGDLISFDSDLPAPIQASALDGKDAEEADNVAQSRPVVSQRQVTGDFTQREKSTADIQNNSARKKGRTPIVRLPSASRTQMPTTFDSRIWGTQHLNRSHFLGTPNPPLSTSHATPVIKQPEGKDPAKQPVYQSPQFQFKMANQSGASDGPILPSSSAGPSAPENALKESGK